MRLGQRPLCLSVCLTVCLAVSMSGCISLVYCRSLFACYNVKKSSLSQWGSVDNMEKNIWMERGGVGVCSVPCNRKVTGLNLPQATA